MSRWGDWHLGFGDQHEPTRGRTGAPWAAIHAGGRGVLWAQATAPGWYGHSVRAVHDALSRAWLVGEVYGPPPDDVTILAMARGEVSTADLPGSWLLVGWLDDTQGGYWSVVTDRLGSLHAYRLDAECTALSTAFRSLVGRSRRRLDGAAVAGFMATGFYPGERTLLADIRILRPARRYVLTDEGSHHRVETTWRWRSTIGSSMAPRHYSDAIDAFDERLRTVMGDCLAHGRVAVPISGGLDSRSTVTVLPPAATADVSRLWSYAYGWGANSVETRIARQIAQKRRLGFVALDVPPYLLDQLGEVHAAVEGFQDLTQTRQAAIAPWLDERADAVIAAHWGDVWLDAMGAGEGTSDAALLDLAASKMLKRGRGWLLDHVVRPLLDPHDPSAADPEGVVRDQMAAELARVARVEDPDLRLKAFKTEQWSFRWTVASLRAFRLGAVPRLPFYDSRLVDFFLGLPADWLAGRRLQRDHLLRFAPGLARVPWQQTGLPLAPSGIDRVLELGGRAARKLGRLAVGRSVVERNWEVQLRGADRPARLRDLLLRPRAPHLEWIDRRAVAALLDRFAARPDPAIGYTVSMLLTLVVALADLDGGVP